MECINMADVKTNNCFPTLIHEFKLDLDHDKMLDYIESNLETTGQMQQTTNVDLHKLLYLNLWWMNLI